MNVRDAIINRRTVREFSSERIDTKILYDICELSRLYASSANLQPVRFKIINSEDKCEEIFSNIKLAAYIPNFSVSKEKQPNAYILLLTDKNICSNPQFDLGAAATNIMLLSKEYDLDTCCIGNFSKEIISSILHIDTNRYEPMYLMAIGKRAQDNRICPFTDKIEYEYVDGTFIVPKRDISDLII